MDFLVNLIVGDAASFDFVVLVRLIVFLFILDFVATVISTLGGSRR